MLAATSVLAVVFLVFAQAVRGSSWAVGVSVAVVLLAGTMLVHGLLFFLVWLFSQLTEHRQQRRQPVAAASVPQVATSPFAAPLSDEVAPAPATAHAEPE